MATLVKGIFTVAVHIEPATVKTHARDTLPLRRNVVTEAVKKAGLTIVSLRCSQKEGCTLVVRLDNSRPPTEHLVKKLFMDGWGIKVHRPTQQEAA